MLSLKDFFSQSFLLIRLGLPIFLGQFSQMSMALVDTIMASRYSTVSMAAVGLGGAFWVPCLLFAQGLLNCITPLVAQASGQAQSKEEMNSYWHQGFWLALALSIMLFAILTSFSDIIMMKKDIEPELAHVTADYIYYIKWGMPAFCLLYICRFYLEGLGITRPSMISGIVGLICNIPLNYIFIFGHFGMPALGGAGCGLASAIVCWIMAFVLVFSLAYYSPKTMAIRKIVWKKLWRMFRIGIPVAFAQLLEVSSFTLISYFIAPLGAVVVAGHQAALNVSSLVFMSPLSLGIATNIRIANGLGAKKYIDAVSIRKSSMLLALIFSFCTFIFVLVLRHEIAYLYSHDPAVVTIASYILIFTALYQIPDWIQIIAMSSLRAYNDTKVIFLSCLICYWGVSLPLGYILCFHAHFLGLAENLGVVGFWIGLICGLTLAFFVFFSRVIYLEKKSPDFILNKLMK